nr:MAG TPA: hypothetical protein [Caudoviricetes sp.]
MDLNYKDTKKYRRLPTFLGTISYPELRCKL